MGHISSKDIYRKLGGRIDSLTVRAPWTDALHGILKELYTAREAELLVKMPWGFSTLEKIVKVTGEKEADIQKILDVLASKGLVLDIKMGKSFRYMIAPMVVGIFEYTMMRTGKDLDKKKMSRLFHEYMITDPSFYRENFGRDMKVSISRALPWEETVKQDEYTEILDYDRASAIIGNAKKFSLGICSCRHEKEHLGKRECSVPLEVCSSFGAGAEFLIRHGFAREVSRTEMSENLARSREMGLTLCADNTMQSISFICHCCGCCCNLLQGISRWGCSGIVVTSSYIADVDDTGCSGCGKCADACTIHAIAMLPDESAERKRKKKPVVDTSICLGCGACALKCETQSMKLARRKARVIKPQNTFERVLLQCLERGTLQNFLFKNPQSITHTFMRGFIGGFLRLPPVKAALMKIQMRFKCTAFKSEKFCFFMAQVL